MIQSAMSKLLEKKNLTLNEARESIGEILRGEVPASLISGFLVALRMKGETPEEIAGCAKGMQEATTKIDLNVPVVVDTCGTGGDQKGSFNISTAAAFVVAGAGFTVAKHGNRSVSSQCGSADVLEILGVKTTALPPVVETCLKDAGIGFLFAPVFHPAMKHAMPVRRELGVRTVFNILGPLCNPAGANAQVIGVFSEKIMDGLAKVLVKLGAKHALLVHSHGYDEITLSRPSVVVEIMKGKIKKRKLGYRDFGFKKAVPQSALRGGSKEENAKIVLQVLEGHKGPQRDIVLANASAAILVAARAGGCKDIQNLKQARFLAETSIDSGAANEKLKRLASLSHMNSDV